MLGYGLGGTSSLPKVGLGPLYKQKAVRIQPEDYFKALAAKKPSKIKELKERYKKTGDILILKQINNIIQEEKLGQKKE